jgi:hypothetical protein
MCNVQVLIDCDKGFGYVIAKLKWWYMVVYNKWHYVAVMGEPTNFSKFYLFCQYHGLLLGCLQKEQGI